MVTRNTKYWLGVFFCSVGCICNSSALGAGEDIPALAGEPIPPDATPALFETASEDEALPQGQQVEVGSFGQIDLHVKDLDLTKVLQLLSIQSQRNIIASRNVAGTVSADLYGVDFYEALDAILHTNGFGYREKGQFIYVYTADELAQLEEQDRELAYKIVRLNYINAADASAFVSPLLSSNGSIALSGESEDGFEPSLSDGGANQSAHQDTLVIRDYPENIEQILAVIEELDTRPKQVLVEATILQARLTEANAFGVDFAVFADLNLTDFSTPLGSVNDLITGSGPNGDFDSGSAVSATPGNVAQGQNSIKFGVLGSDAAVFVRALDSVTDTTVLAKPQVLVLNRQKVNLLVGERLGYLSTTATETSNTQTVEFLDVGTQLTLRPFISNDDFVRMELRPSVSDGSTSLVGGFVIPDTTTQELVSNVIVKSGQTVVLGGLFKEDTTIGRTAVPGLGNLPVVGPAFKGQDDDVTRSEVIFMIKPTIQKDEDLTRMADSVHADIESTRLGMRKGLLPWSRTKLTSKYITDAMNYMKQGDNEKALWSLDKALYLDPTMADALRLKEQITGEKTYFYDRSILKNAVDSMIDAEVSANIDPDAEIIDIDPSAPTDIAVSEQDPEASFDDLTAAEDEVEATGEFASQPTEPVQAEADTAVEGEATEPVQAVEVIDPFDAEPTAEFDESDWQAEPVSDGSEFSEQPAGESAQDFDAESQAQTDQPAVEAPWRVELNPEADGDWSAEEGGETAEVEVYDPDQFYADRQAEEQAEADQPVNIFEFVDNALGAGSEEADAESEAEVSSVDTDEHAE